MFDPGALAAVVAAQAQVVRVVVARVHGSAPREPGASMLAWDEGQAGTIGGGALEWQAAREARAFLSSGEDARVVRQPLGPALAQCCGGAVVLVFERWDGARLAALQSVQGVAARRISADAALQPPLSIRRAMARARDRGAAAAINLAEGWLLEPLAQASREVWIWGAGHVGRALVGVLAPLPVFDLHWLDTAPERFPEQVPPGVTCHARSDLTALVLKAGPAAEHLVVSYSHAIDLELCHRLLGHGFGALGLIGSTTKRARFRTRLAALGHSAETIERIRCPIGEPGLGKHPQAIAIGVAQALLERPAAAAAFSRRAGR